MRFSAALPAILAALASAQTPPNLTALLTGQSQLSSFVQLLGVIPNVTSALAATPNLTIFVPNNKALAAILEGGGIFSLEEVARDPRLVEAIVRYHVVKGVVRSSDIKETQTFAPTLLNYTTLVADGGVAGSNITGGQVISVQLEKNEVVLTTGLKSTAKVVQADLTYNNGVVHIIDSLLTIPQLVSETAIAGNFSALAGAAISTNLITALDTTPDLTIFVPNNAAFQQIEPTLRTLNLSQIASALTYHVIPGTVAYSTLLKAGSIRTLNGASVYVRVESNGAVFVNQARVINADVLVANGVIHVIDSVLLPGVNVTSPARPAAPVPFISGLPTPTMVQSELLQSTSVVIEGTPTGSASSTRSAPAQATTNAAVGGLRVGAMEMAVLVGGVVGLAL